MQAKHSLRKAAFAAAGVGSLPVVSCKTAHQNSDKTRSSLSVLQAGTLREPL
jgi:hypothetical protein